MRQKGDESRMITEIRERTTPYGAHVLRLYPEDLEQQMLDHLTVILGFSRILQNRLDGNPLLCSYAIQINQSADLLSELIASAVAKEGIKYGGMMEGGDK